jgi:ribosomal protein S18 acetylase RimI-like enzyme
MKIRPILEKDRATLLSMLIKTCAFTSAEIDVAMELIDIVLKDRVQKDYQIECMVNDQDLVVGYVCYGPTPMAQGTFDVYWISVNPDYQERGAGSKLLSFLEEVVKARGGWMILADSSTVPHFEKTKKFYLKNGFQEVARVPDYYHPGNDRITFCKRPS